MTRKNNSASCRPHCGACCIAPSINAPIPGMPSGKKAGEYCINLDRDSFHCRIWGQDNYPDFCRAFAPHEDSCGQDRSEAIRLIDFWEQATAPESKESNNAI